MLLALHRRLVEADRLARAPWGEQSWLERHAPARVAHARARRPRPHRPGDGGAHAPAGRRRSRPTIPASPPLPDGVTPLRQPRRAARVERPRLAAPAVAARDREAARCRAVRAHAPGRSARERLARRPDRRGRPRRRARGGQIGGAALDVFAREPLAADAPHPAAPNTVLSPHVAWFSTASGPKVRRDTVEAMIVWIESGTVPHGNLAARPVRSRRGCPRESREQRIWSPARTGASAPGRSACCSTRAAASRPTTSAAATTG